MGWAVEEVQAITHTGTHVDAPYHYGPVSEGKPARTIDQVPLEWCFAPGVVLDVRHKAAGEFITVADLQAALAHIHYQLRPLDIVLLPAACLGGPLPTFDEPQLVTTPERGQRLNAALGQAAGVLMRWHGATVVGDTLEEMFNRAVSLEDNARLLWEARAIGNPLPLDVTAAARDTANPMVSARTFNYYVNLERPLDQQRHMGRSGESR